MSDVIFGDSGYTSEVYDPDSISRFGSLDFYRDKIREFQVSLNELDNVAREVAAYAALPLPPAQYAEAFDWLADYEQRRRTAVLAADAINTAANTANALGVRMPVLSIPQGLQGVGLAPAALAAIAAAVAGGAWFLGYAVEKIMAARAMIEVAQSNADIIGSIPESQRAQVATELARAQSNIAAAQARAENPIASAANLVKWIALATAGFFAFKVYQQMRAGE